MNAQNWIVGAIVLTAAFFFLRKMKRAFKGEANGGCDKCAK